MAVDRQTRAHQQLVTELRRLKHASGLSYARLQAHTPYSRSSLERYVNGKLFPSRQAVCEIAQACGAEPDELLRIWDVAVAEDEPLPAPIERSETGRGKAPRLPGDRRLRVAATVLVLLALVFGSVYADQHLSRSPAAASAAPTAPPPEIWSRRLSIVTADSTRNGWLEVTLDWQGKGPYHGRIYGSVHVRDQDGLCAQAYAWYDGTVKAIGQACGRTAGGAVSGDFRHTWRALVEVCLRYGSAQDPQWCSAWS
ncbi:helix-turn-helix transcriptional regulator [Actinoplanes sp. NPDC051411]|uniref:helix-turn-helix domain-containing protein n=1 Tax=Actinoplanes sp. NPDC051411 TaxID=3155522 RepID=UPI003414B7D1